MPRASRNAEPVVELRGSRVGGEQFNEDAYAMIRRIPEGKVASYGQIAELIGRPTNSRRVGAALKVMPSHLGSPYLPQERRPARIASQPADSSSGAQEGRRVRADVEEEREDDVEGVDEASDDDEPLPAPLPNPEFVPWHRVLSSTGLISPRGNLNAVLTQADWLRAEGVVVDQGVRGPNDIPNPGAGGVAGLVAGAGGRDAFGLGGTEGGRVSMRVYRWDGRF